MFLSNSQADPAFYVHEVIDQGGEPIKVQEYFGVGRVTEFRYGIKVGESVRNKNYAALGGVYDQVSSTVEYNVKPARNRFKK